MRIRSLLLFILIVALGMDLSAQSNTMYYLWAAPQSYKLNPATQPQCRFFLGLPLLNSFFIETRNTSFGLSDLIWNDPETGQVMNPFLSPATMDDFFNKLDDDVEFSFDLSASPVSLGFGIKEMYFTFDVTARITQDFTYPGAMFPLSSIWIENNRTYDLSSLSFGFTTYMEYALGISRNFSDVLQVGIRPKLLTGIANITSRNNSLTLYSSALNYDLNSTLNVSLSMPGFDIPLNENGALDLAGDFVFDTTINSFPEYRKLLLTNKGFGIDFGAHFKPVPILTISASVIDLGFIRWKDYTYNATLEGNVRFEGIPYGAGQDSLNLTAMMDTLRESFTASGTASGSYTTGLNTKLFIGGSLAVLPKLDVGILSRFDFMPTGTRTNVMLHASWHPRNFTGVTVMYSPFGGRASTFGLGVMLRGGPFNLYTTADYRAFRYKLYKYGEYPVFLAPANRSRFNFQIGLNVMLGCNKKKRLMKDKPMYISNDY